MRIRWRQSASCRTCDLDFTSSIKNPLACRECRSSTKRRQLNFTGNYKNRGAGLAIEQLLIRRSACRRCRVGAHQAELWTAETPSQNFECTSGMLRPGASTWRGWSPPPRFCPRCSASTALPRSDRGGRPVRVWPTSLVCKNLRARQVGSVAVVNSESVHGSQESVARR